MTATAITSGSPETRRLVAFTLHGRSLALPLEAVERVVHAVEATPLAGAPFPVLGIVDVAGRVMPLLSLRRILGLTERDIRPEDQFLIARTSRRSVALMMDEARGLLDLPESMIVPPDRIYPGLERIQGVAQLEDGLILIHDLERFLSLEEEQASTRRWATQRQGVRPRNVERCLLKPAAAQQTAHRFRRAQIQGLAQPRRRRAAGVASFDRDIELPAG